MRKIILCFLVLTFTCCAIQEKHKELEDYLKSNGKNIYSTWEVLEQEDITRGNDRLQHEKNRVQNVKFINLKSFVSRAIDEHEVVIFSTKFYDFQNRVIIDLLPTLKSKGINNICLLHSFTTDNREIVDINHLKYQDLRCVEPSYYKMLYEIDKHNIIIRNVSSRSRGPIHKVVDSMITDGKYKHYYKYISADSIYYQETLIDTLGSVTLNGNWNKEAQLAKNYVENVLPKAGKTIFLLVPNHSYEDRAFSFAAYLQSDYGIDPLTISLNTLIPRTSDIYEFSIYKKYKKQVTQPSVLLDTISNKFVSGFNNGRYDVACIIQPRVLEKKFFDDEIFTVYEKNTKYPYPVEFINDLPKKITKKKAYKLIKKHYEPK